MKRKILFILIAMATMMAQATSYTLINDTLRSSKYYLGTSHSYQVYIPDGYKSGTPACLYVGLDGILCNAAKVMDSLICEGKMPMTIGIFLQPGVIKDATGHVVRYNRSNEFDMTTSKFADFLEAEIIPEALSHKTPDGRILKISDKASDHMICGLSSGGIASFVAAWQRPDLFGRVFSAVGTFVTMRGGEEMPMWVRKSEPRAIKICLQDGSKDAWNPLFGSWYEGNKMLASALDFAGYTTKYDWGTGGHNVKRATAIFRDVMTWMWDDSQPVVAGKTKNDLLCDLLVEGSSWQKATVNDSVAANPSLVEYPDGCHAVKAVAGSNMLNQVILEDGKQLYDQPFYWLHSYNNSALEIGPMAFDANGNLWVVTNAGIQICDQNGRVRGIIMLPRETAKWHALQINDGSVTLITVEGTAYTRAFNIKPAIKGQRPKSQGQG